MLCRIDPRPWPIKTIHKRPRKDIQIVGIQNSAIAEFQFALARLDLKSQTFFYGADPVNYLK
jgi:hypothetical protein